MSPTPRKYLVNVGMDYPSNGDGENHRAEVGDEVDDLPEEAVAGLLKAGYIENVKPGPKPKTAKGGDS
jgi:hypothetical protein